MLELIDVSKSFGPTRVLDRVSLAVASGRTTVLLGPSGGGKTTILRALLGLVWPDSGEVRFGGTSITPHNIRTLRQRMGYVVQDGGLFPHLTAAGNVALMANHLGWPRNRIQKQLADLARLARLPAELLDRYPAQLSGGQRQRVGLMRALMLEPEVLLLDEPLGALDPITRTEMQTDLRAAFRSLNKTVVLVTHDLTEAAYLADDVVLVGNGRIAQRGKLRDLIHQPATAFVTEFVEAQRGPLDALREATA